MAESESSSEFFYLDGFDELVWDGIYWSGQVELPAWKEYDLRWMAAIKTEEDEEAEDEWQDLDEAEMEELRKDAEHDPEAAELLLTLEADTEPGVIGLSFSVVETVEMEEDPDVIPPPPYPEQVAAAEYARDEMAHVQEVILKDALELYESFRPKMRGTLGLDLPKLDTPDELKDHLRLVGLNPLTIAKDGVAYTAYYFTCTWDLDEGLPYIMHRDRVVLVGLTTPENDEELLLKDGGDHLGEAEDAADADSGF